jgi:hypothetical protein
VVAIGFAAAGIGSAVSDHTTPAAIFGLLALALQLVSLRVPGRGSISGSSIALIAAGIALGPGFAMAAAASAAAVQWIKSRTAWYRGLFDIGNFVLAAGAASELYRLPIDSQMHHGSVRVVLAAATGLVYAAVNNALLCIAMGLSEQRSPLALFRERFAWAGFYFACCGLVGLALVSAYDALGASSAAVLGVAGALFVLSMRDRLAARGHEAREPAVDPV